MSIHSGPARVALLAALLLLPAVDASAQIALRAASSASVPTLPQLRASGPLAFANSGNVTPVLSAGTGPHDLLSACETGLSSPPATLSFAAGRASLALTVLGAGNDGGVDLNPRLSSTDTGSVCLNGASSAATDANRPWLQFNWSGSGGFDQNPVGRAAFGLSRKPAELIYFREMY
jgi:hypothetical protein